MHLKEEKPKSIQELGKKLRITLRLTPLMLSLGLTQNRQTSEVCGLGHHSVVSVVRSDTYISSVQTRCHPVGSGEMRMLPLYDRSSLDNMGNHNNSLDRLNKVNNLARIYNVTPVANPDILHGIALKSLSRLRQ